MNRCGTVPNHHEDCAVKEPVRPGSESCDTVDQDFPDSVRRGTKFNRCSVSGRSCSQGAKTVEVATGAVHEEDQTEGAAEH